MSTQHLHLNVQQESPTCTDLTLNPSCVEISSHLDFPISKRHHHQFKPLKLKFKDITFYVTQDRSANPVDQSCNKYYVPTTSLSLPPVPSPGHHYFLPGLLQQHSNCSSYFHSCLATTRSSHGIQSHLCKDYSLLQDFSMVFHYTQERLQVLTMAYRCLKYLGSVPDLISWYSPHHGLYFAHNDLLPIPQTWKANLCGSPLDLLCS